MNGETAAVAGRGLHALEHVLDPRAVLTEACGLLSDDGMLIFSTGIILYASLFTSPEARFLLCSPARAVTRSR